MLFNSFVFIVFTALFFLFWPLARRNSQVRWAYLVLASFIFYAWWDWRFLFLILASGSLDYLAGLAMRSHPSRRKVYLSISVCGNIGSLMVFKYSGFVAGVLEDILSLMGYNVSIRSAIPHGLLILPVGISFYTFQSMSYTMDVYRGHLEPTRNVLHFFAYLAMFPQLVAGPIVRAKDLLPQLCTCEATGEKNRFAGLKLVISGLFKKVVIADNLAPMVSEAFGAPILSDASIYWWIITTAFAFQIYCDFSGYSDIARGLAKWMGYEFQVNFNHPYRSISLREFWTRWHISLSSWFRDYVYSPLGGGRQGKGRAHITMWITMLVSAAWHGAAWHFIVWGVVHACFLSLERVTNWPARLRRVAAGRLLAGALLITQVWVAWVFFRAETVGQAVSIIRTLFSFSGANMPELSLNGLLVLAVAVTIELCSGIESARLRFLPTTWYRLTEPAFWAFLAVCCIFLRGPGHEFIYFQF